MRTTNQNLTMILFICIVGLITSMIGFDMLYRENLKSAEAKAFNEGRLRQCTYTFGCDMKALKAELFDQQRKLDKQRDKSGN